MKPPGHAVVSLGIGAIVWGFTKSPYSVLAAFLTGVLIDLDHLVEYYSWFVREERSKVWFFLHSYELAVPAFLAGYMSGWDPVVLGVSAGFLGHVLTDQVVNPMRPLAYFFTYRAIKGFRRSELLIEGEGDGPPPLTGRTVCPASRRGRDPERLRTW